MTYSSFVNENFIIITTWLSFITEKVNFFKTVKQKYWTLKNHFSTTYMTLVCLLCLFRDVAQAVCFVPSIWKHIETDLTANAVGQVNVFEFLPQCLNHCCSYFVLIIIESKRVSFLPRALAPNWAYVHHSISELNKRSAFNW
jgi:hypothetical protein